MCVLSVHIFYASFDQEVRPKWTHLRAGSSRRKRTYVYYELQNNCLFRARTAFGLPEAKKSASGNVGFLRGFSTSRIAPVRFLLAAI